MFTVTDMVVGGQLVGSPGEGHKTNPDARRVSSVNLAKSNFLGLGKLETNSLDLELSFGTLFMSIGHHQGPFRRIQSFELRGSFSKRSVFTSDYHHFFTIREF